MAKWLITGGAGFIGKATAAELIRRGEDVRVLDNLSTSSGDAVMELYQAGKYEFILGDIRKQSDCKRAVDGVDYVVHLAALGSVPRSMQTPDQTNDHNVAGTLNVFIAARDAGVKGMASASSSSIYGGLRDFQREEQPPFPMSPYAASKLAGEMYARIFAESFGLPVVSLRYFNVYGPGQRADGPYCAVIPIWIRCLLNGESPTVHGTGEQARDFTFIDDVVDANILAATHAKPSSGEAFNVGAGGRTSLLEIHEHLSNIIGRLPLMYAERRPGDVDSTWSRIKKMEHAFGWTPKTAIYEGLLKTVVYYRSQRAA
jgi:nucleoside-diphosphate-sugar epimerase